MRIVALGEAGEALHLALATRKRTGAGFGGGRIEHWVPLEGSASASSPRTSPTPGSEQGSRFFPSLDLSYEPVLPLLPWFLEGQGFPEGISPLNAPVRLAGLPATPVAGSQGQERIGELVVRPDDLLGVAVLPAVIEGLRELQPPGAMRVWLLADEDHGRFDAPGSNRLARTYLGLREILWALGEPWAAGVVWVVLDKPGTITGLPVGGLALLELLDAAAEVSSGQGDLPAPREPAAFLDRDRPFPRVFHGAGEARLEICPEAFHRRLLKEAGEWFEQRRASCPFGEISGEAALPWESCWGFRPGAFRRPHAVALDRTQYEAFLAERVWTGGGWNADVERAVRESTRGWLTRQSERVPAAEAGVDPGSPVAGLLETLSRRLADRFTCLAAAPEALLFLHPWPEPWDVLASGHARGYGPFLDLKIEELTVRLGADADPRLRLHETLEGAVRRASSEFENRAGPAAPDDPGMRTGWEQLVRSLSSAVEWVLLFGSRERLRRLRTCWERLHDDDGEPQEEPAVEDSSLPAGDWEDVVRVVLRIDLGVEGWQGVWERVAGSLLAGKAGSRQEHLREALTGVSRLSAADWGRRLRWGRASRKLTRDGQWEDRFWGELDETRPGGPASDVLTACCRAADTELVEELTMGFARRLALRARPAAGRWLPFRARVCLRGDSMVSLERLRDFAGVVEPVAVPGSAGGCGALAAGRMAQGFSWSDPMGLDAFDLLFRSAREWERTKEAGAVARSRPLAGEEPTWNPGTAAGRGRETALRRAARVMIALLQAREQGLLDWDAAGRLVTVEDGVSQGEAAVRPAGSTLSSGIVAAIRHGVVPALRALLPSHPHADAEIDISADALRLLWLNAPEDVRRPLPLVTGGPSLLRRLLREHLGRLGPAADPETALSEGYRVLDDLNRSREAQPWRQALGH